MLWINDVLDLDLKDISQANNGAVACQLLDRLNPLNPEVVNLRKVDYNAASAYYMEQNWRILQRAFVELEIDWNVDVVRCQQGHQMELLLLFRLFKQRYDTWEAELAAVGEQMPPYDAKARRAASKSGDIRDPLARSPSRPASPQQAQTKLDAGRNRMGDDDSAKEYVTKAPQGMVSHGTEMGSSFKGEKKVSLWTKLKHIVGRERRTDDRAQSGSIGVQHYN